MSMCRFNFAPASPSTDEDHIPTDFHPAQDELCAPVFFNNMGCAHFMMHLWSALKIP